MWCPLELLSLFSRNELALSLDEIKQTIEIERAKKEIKLSFIVDSLNFSKLKFFLKKN